MKKFWMMGGAIIAATVAAMVWNSLPVRSSQNLLSKAQSEFATKARDALKQRQMAQAPIVSTPTATPKSIPLPPDVFPLLEPVATAPVAVPETSVEVAALETPTVTPASLDTAVSRDSLSSPAILPAPAPLPAPAIEDAPAARAPQMASLPEEPKAPVLPRRIDVASMAEVANAEPPAVTRTLAEPQRQYSAERKTRHVQRKRRTHDVYRSEYRSERWAPRYSTPYNLETLRARAPEIAAAIARYM